MKTEITPPPDVVIDGNVFAAGAAGGTAISFLGTRYATPGAYNSAYDRNNRGCMPSFVSYTPGVYSGRNLGLRDRPTFARRTAVSRWVFSTRTWTGSRDRKVPPGISARTRRSPSPSSFPTKAPLPK